MDGNISMQLDGQLTIGKSNRCETAPIGQGAGSSWRELYHLIWVEAGTGVVSADTWSRELVAGFVCCSQPADVRLQANENGIIRYVSIHADLLRSLFMSFGLVETPFFEPVAMIGTAPEWLVSVQCNLEAIVDRFSIDEVFLAVLLKGWIKSLLSTLASRVLSVQDLPGDKTAIELSGAFIAAVKNSGGRCKTVNQFARELHVTPGHLNKMVKKATGFTASHHIRQTLVSEARMLALDRSRSMKAIAYHLGFEDSAHFSKFFKKVTGANFSDYRKGGCRHELVT